MPGDMFLQQHQLATGSVPDQHQLATGGVHGGFVLEFYECYSLAL